MTTETINGLHKCKAKNTPQQGEVKNMVVEHKPPRNGKKAWIKITNKKPEEGGSPYRILAVEELDWPPDEHQNIAFNIKVEASSSQPSAFQQARSTMQHPTANMPISDDRQDWPEAPENAPQSPPARSNGGDGVTETRKHLMKVANLYNLCISAVDKAIAPNLPEIARTSEQFQATLASLFIEASSRRTTDGVNWWSYVDRMPDTPLAPSQSQQGKPRSTAPLPQKPVCTCENTDGDNPLCPVHSE